MKALREIMGQSTGDRRGVTIVELLVVVVLGAVILAAAYQVLITNQRTYAAQSANVRANQTLRGGMEVLFTELREISPQDGDILTMNSSQLRVRAGEAAGIVCTVLSTPGNPLYVQIKPMGHYLQDRAARIFVDNRPDQTSDDVWQTTTTLNQDSTGLLFCPDGESAQEIRLQGLTLGPPPDSLLPGAIVRTLAPNEYRLGTYDGQTYLMREDEIGDVYPLVGPLSGNNGVTFRYLDADGNVTATAADVRQIDVTLRSPANIRNLSGDLTQDSLRARIYTRN